MSDLQTFRPIEGITFEGSSTNSNIIASMFMAAMICGPQIPADSYEPTTLIPTNSGTFNNFSDYSQYHLELFNRLDEISNLQENWNDNGAGQFNEDLILKAKEFITNLEFMSQYVSIFPTANDSLQIEAISSDDTYYEAEIFKDLIEIYSEKNDVELVNEEYNSITEAAIKYKNLYI